MRRSPVRDEPLTITAAVVAQFLDDFGCPRMSEFVRELGDNVRKANVTAMELREKYNAIVRELYPQQQQAPPTYRSEWD